MAYQVWRGSISFGLVNVGVRAFPATRDSKVRFHQIDTTSGSRIGYEKVSKSTGETVEKTDIALGYEVEPGRWVTFDPDEISAMKPSSTRAVDITEFVDLAAIDPIHYEKTYWLLPADEAAQKPYGLLAAAMESEQKVGIGTVVMRTKEYLAAIRPLQGGLAMSTMRFADEVVPLSELEGSEPLAEPAERELELAVQIIEGLAAPWDPEAYSDTYNDELRALIAKKAAGDEVLEETPGEEASAGTVLDLMSALEASLEEARQPRSERDAG